MTKKALGRVTAELLELADDMHRIGVMDAKTHHKITIRPPVRTPQQQVQAPQRRAEGATLKELARSYDVSQATISRLKNAK
jgi:hypothetical protein